MKKIFSHLCNHLFKESVHGKNILISPNVFPVKIIFPKEILLLESSAKLFCPYKTVERFFVDKKGFTNDKIIDSENVKEAIKECIIMKIASPITIVKILTTSKPLVVSGKSGIYAPPPTLVDDITLPLKICTLMCKFTFTVLGQKVFLSEKDIIFKLEEFFNISQNFEDMYNFYPIAQHMINSMLANLKFCPTLLYELTGLHVDYSFYMDNLIDISKIIESIVIKKTILPFFQKYKEILYIIAQNPDNPKSDHVKYASLAYKLMKQPHPDLRVENYLTKKIIFYDIKLRADLIKNLSTMKGVLTLIPSLKEKDKLLYMNKTRADLGNTQKTVLDLNTKKAIALQISKIKKLETNKNLTMSQKEYEFNEIQNAIDLDANIFGIACSRVVKTDYDVFFDKVYKESPQIEEQLKKIATEIGVSILIPAQGQGHQIAQVWHWKELCLKVISIAPPYLKPILYKNLLLLNSLEQ